VRRGGAGLSGVGRRSRQRRREVVAAPAELSLPPGEYEDAEGNVLMLRASLGAGARREYADALHGGLHREDARQRATELLFERLAVKWTIAGEPLDRQQQLLARYRAATHAERDFVRESLRTHVREHFPELDAP
jgi:hypothetical protein